MMRITELQFENKHFCKMISGKGLLADVKSHLISLLPGNRAVILTNPYLKALYGNKLIADLTKNDISVNTITVPDSEKAKSITTVQNVFNDLVGWKIDRTTSLITLGGGVVGDLGGFVASTFKRGIPLVHIPTTLLAQIDSSIGGKTALDHPQAKNIIGTFYQPQAVLSDSEVLQSLPIRQIKNGLVEAIKIAIIKNPSLFQWIEHNLASILKKEQEALDFLVQQAMQEKIDLILFDPWEKKERQYLNLGHTVGHGWETMGNYQSITHGEAVALGIVLETKIAYKRGICTLKSQKRIKDIISFLFNSFAAEPFSSLLFPHQEIEHSKEKDNGILFDKFWDILIQDKKNKEGRVVFILPEKIGKVSTVNNVTREEFITSLKEFIAEKEKEC